MCKGVLSLDYLSQLVHGKQTWVFILAFVPVTTKPLVQEPFLFSKLRPEWKSTFEVICRSVNSLTEAFKWHSACLHSCLSGYVLNQLIGSLFWSICRRTLKGAPKCWSRHNTLVPVNQCDLKVRLSLQGVRSFRHTVATKTIISKRSKPISCLLAPEYRKFIANWTHHFAEWRCY